MGIVEADVAIEDAAEQLFAARRQLRAISPVRRLLRYMDVEAAYQVQQINVRRRLDAGERMVGRKIGLTSEAVQRQLGVDQPDFGVLFEATYYGGQGAEVAVSTLIAPRIEAEFAFLLGADIGEGAVNRDSVGRAVEAVAVAAEIVDSAIAGWDINIVDTIADNASCGGFVVGPWVAYSRDLDLPSRHMRMTLNGEQVSSGQGSATLGDPLNALAWLAKVSIANGEPLRAGEIILAGALGPMISLTPGDYVIEIDGFKPLWVRARP
jgi:2-keto-4-pentenoate hydratase